MWEVVYQDHLNVYFETMFVNKTLNHLWKILKELKTCNSNQKNSNKQYEKVMTSKTK